MRSVRGWTLLLLSVSILGCGAKGEPPVPAGGIAKINGKPAEGLLIQLHPTAPAASNQPVQSFSAISGADGRFELKTSDNRSGAVPGTYKVIVVDNKLSELGDDPSKAKTKIVNRVPFKYASATTTPLEITVEKGKSEYIVDILP